MVYEGSDRADKKVTIKVSLRDALNELKLPLCSPKRSVMRYHRNEFEPVFDENYIYLVDDTIYEIFRTFEEQS